MSNRAKIPKMIRIPDEALLILGALNTAGYEAFVVGGCVRDALLGRTASDWDIATDALPVQVKALFPKTIDTGLKHGTITVVVNGMSFETTTYRIEGGYSDSRRPDWVEFTPSLEADLSRRDFTMNAIAYHPDKGFTDPLGGMADIAGHIIRTVGQAGDRYSEDALRMLRAVRFSAQLSFELEPLTFSALKEFSHLITHISQERIRDELEKMLLSADPEKISLLHETGLLKYILPEFDRCFDFSGNNPCHIYNNTYHENDNPCHTHDIIHDIAAHSLKAVSLADMDLQVRWALLFHDTGKPLAGVTGSDHTGYFPEHARKSAGLALEAMKRLRLNSRTINVVQRLVEYHDYPVRPEPAAVRRAVFKIGEDIFDLLLKVKEADIRAQDPDSTHNGPELLRQVKQYYNYARQNAYCMGLNSLAINGHDLMELGQKPGPELGMLLQRLLEAVIDDPGLNTQESLLKLAQSMANETEANAANEGK